MRRAHAWTTSSLPRDSGRRMSTEKHFQDSVDNLTSPLLTSDPSNRRTRDRRAGKRGVWHDGSTSGIRASSSGRPGRDTFQDTGGSRWVRHRSHLAAAAPSRACASRHRPVRRRRALRQHARALPRRPHVVVALPAARRCHRRPPAARDAFDCRTAVSDHRLGPGRRGVHVPPGRGARAADVRELSRPAPRAAGAADGADGQPQPVRADHAGTRPGRTGSCATPRRATR